MCFFFFCVSTTFVNSVCVCVYIYENCFATGSINPRKSNCGGLLIHVFRVVYYPFYIHFYDARLLFANLYIDNKHDKCILEQYYHNVALLHHISLKIQSVNYLSIIMASEWNDEHVLNLLGGFKNYCCLWDPKDIQNTD